jgi:hypothetical protein
LKELARNSQQRKELAKKPGSAPVQTYQEVEIKSLANTDSRSLGPELVVFQTWKLLEFDKLLDECGFSPKEQALAAAVIWGRLISPGSDLSTWKWLREESSLSEFFPADISRVHKDRVYEIADRLLAQKQLLEDRLYTRQCDLFPGRETLFLFDLTNFYFEGKCEGNDLASRGKSKEKRQSNPLVSLALVVDQDGFPVRSKVYKGNVSEPATLEEILENCGLLDTKEDLFRPVIAMDRGIATKDNVSLLQKYNFPYAVAEAIWRTYTTLTQVEAAFRSMKTDLGTRPVFHQGAERTEAHLFISILAYHMLINIEHRLKACNEHARWHKLRECLQTHRRSTITWKNRKGETWHKRLSSSAEARHLQIYGKLGIEDPLDDLAYKA